ncbi:MAG: hypothetical protein IPN76_02220 [Saprospiraceae bacterium]|nr:hypothetical protein [Saprospiraceae bacterium]
MKYSLPILGILLFCFLGCIRDSDEFDVKSVYDFSVNNNDSLFVEKTVLVDISFKEFENDIGTNVVFYSNAGKFLSLAGGNQQDTLTATLVNNSAKAQIKLDTVQGEFIFKVSFFIKNVQYFAEKLVQVYAPAQSVILEPQTYDISIDGPDTLKRNEMRLLRLNLGTFEGLNNQQVTFYTTAGYFAENGPQERALDSINTVVIGNQAVSLINLRDTSGVVLFRSSFKYNNKVYLKEFYKTVY